MDRGEMRKSRASARYHQNRTAHWKPSVRCKTDACVIKRIDSLAAISCFLLKVSNGIVHAISLVPDFTHFRVKRLRGGQILFESSGNTRRPPLPGLSGPE